MLVVIAIIAILASLLLPALSSAKEKSKRAACESNMRQAIFAMHMYGNDNREELIPAHDNQSTNTWHSIRISNIGHTSLVRYSGNSNILDCINVKFGKRPRYNPAYGYLIGYNYLGNAVTKDWPATGRDVWHSPKKLTESGTNAILADINHWGGGLAFVPHTKTGPVIVNGSSWLTTSKNPKQLGAAGGNVGYLDGSVIWKNIQQMRTNRASSYTLYYGYW